MRVKKLKQVRIDKGYTVRSLAKRIGVNMSSISYWENGVKNPRENNRIKLEEALEVPHVILMEDDIKNNEEEEEWKVLRSFYKEQKIL